jgi:repressor LexA
MSKINELIIKESKDKQYLAKLQDYYAKHRSLPSYARLGEVLGLSAKSGVKKVLERLQKQGYLSRTPDDMWVPEPSFFERFVSNVAVPAGPPTTAYDVNAESFLIDQYLVHKPSQTTLIPVKGDSMRDAVHDGDIAVVERCPTAKPGDLVVAIVDGEFTLKTLIQEKGQFALLPANPDYPIIYPKDKLEIFGIVVGLIRKYV